MSVYGLGATATCYYEQRKLHYCKNCFFKLQNTFATYSKSASNAAFFILILNFCKKMYSKLQRKFDLSIPGEEPRGLVPNF